MTLPHFEFAALAYLSCAFAVGAFFFTIPLVLELLILSLAAVLPGRRMPAPTGEALGRLAVIVPAHNEAKLIGPCVQSLLRAAARVPVTRVDVRVVAHNCEDDTAERAAEAGAKVIVLDEPVGGKGLALDFGFQHALEAGAGAVLVVDADSVVSPELLATAAARFAAGAQAVQCRYEVGNAAANARTRLAALAFRGMNVLRPRGRSRLGLSCGIFGNGFGMRADALRFVPYTANSVVEDLEYHLHLIRAGICVEYLDSVTVLGEMPTGSAAAGTQRARWEGGRALMRRRWTRPLLLEVLRGRPRLLEPLLDLRALPLALTVTLLGAGLAAALGARWLDPQIPWTGGLFAYALLGLGSVLLYVVAAAWLGAEPLKTFGALATAPAYMVWKLVLIPRTRRTARADAAWVRTERNAAEVPVLGTPDHVLPAELPADLPDELP